MSDYEEPPEYKELPDDPHDQCAIKRIIVWQNGLSMVFCEHGQQMPYYQGVYANPVLRARIEAARKGVSIDSGNWRQQRVIAGAP